MLNYEKYAAMLKCEPAVVHAISISESQGDSGAIRFEPHHFPKREWNEIGFNPNSGWLKAQATAKGILKPGVKWSNWRASLALTRKQREKMFSIAMQIDAEAALKATSMGIFQIMGFNHVDAGYLSARDMHSALIGNDDENMMAFTRTVQSWGLAPAFRGKDWMTIATKWNGNGQARVYAAIIEKNYRKITGKKTDEVLRRGASGEAVIELQKALENLGFLSGNQVDGDFGGVTENAVKQYQMANGLTVDGWVGSNTWASLKDSMATTGMDDPVDPPKKESKGDIDVKSWTRFATEVGGLMTAGGAAFASVPDEAKFYVTITACAVVGIAATVFILKKARIV